MAPLVSMQGKGGGRIPMDNGISCDVSRYDLTMIIAAMPTAQCREMHLAACRGDTETAQRLLREATATYYTSRPAAPATSVAMRHAVCYASRTQTRSLP